MEYFQTIKKLVFFFQKVHQNRILNKKKNKIVISVFYKFNRNIFFMVSHVFFLNTLFLKYPIIHNH